MDIIQLIEKKKKGEALSYDEIKWMVDHYVSDDVKDYQMSAMLMAICLKGMSLDETVALTKVMVDSGEIIDLSSLDGIFVDKHSTGGIGDKTSLVLVPLLASCGLKVIKMSGRSLGFTGGTIDKLESIPGLRMDLTKDEILNQLSKIPLIIAGQSEGIAIADKKLYALRDVTATVDAIPLIASSIMSKKIAIGAHFLVLDVKYGSGAFMKSKEDAIVLGQWMKDIGEACQLHVDVVISPMEQPLGFAIGNRLEVLEAIDTLKGHGPSDLVETCFELGSCLLVSTGLAQDDNEARQMMQHQLELQKPYQLFKEMVQMQGGHLIESSMDDVPHTEYLATHDGEISKIDALGVAKAAMSLGAGRFSKEDHLDLDAGVLLHVKEGYKVKKGDIIATLYSHKNDQQARQYLDQAISY